MIQQEPKLNGFILIDKPKGITSFGAIRHIKKILKQKIKIGHTGTLDDFATGLLIICIGKATKKVPSFMNLNKEYIVTAKLGELTDSLDLTGKIIEQQENIKVSKNCFENAIEKLGKKYIQTPPVYSALKHKGQPLYKLARKKKINLKELEKIALKKGRMIEVEKIELTGFSFPFFTIKTTVSKGTYMRSLANDMAKQIGTFATTYELRRTKIGNFTVEKTIKLDKLKAVGDIENGLLQGEQL